MRSLCRLSLALIFLPVWAYAQNPIRGRVMTGSGEPIPAVTLQLSRAEVLLRVTTSDSLGRFVFDDVAPGNYVVYAQRIGFVPFRRNVVVAGAAIDLELKLVDAPINIAGLTVEGQRARARFENEDGVTTRELSKDELKIIPGLAEADVLRAVEAMPGVISTSDLSSAYNVRGGSADQNLILLDGIPIYNPFHLGGIFSIFNSDMVDHAEMMSGGFPAEFGGRVSSVLNVVSDAGTGRFNFDGGVSLLATRIAVGGELASGFSKKLGFESMRYRVGGRRSYFDQLFKPFFDFPYHLSDFQFTAEAWKSATSRFSVTGYLGNDVLNFVGVEDFPLQLDWKWGNSVLGAAWSNRLPNGGAIDVHASYSRFDTHILFPDFGDTRFRSFIDHALVRGSARLPVGKNEVKFGAELNRLAYDNLAEAGGTVFRQGGEHGWQPSVYAQATLRSIPGWLLEPGLREDVWHTGNSPDIAELSPRVALKHFFAKGNAAFKVAVGRYTQFLHSLRDEEFPIGIDVWVITGQRAPHVVSDQVQAGVEWFPNETWYAALEAYHRKFDGVATNNFADDPNTNTDDLLRGTGRSYGADVVVRKDRGRTRGFITVSYLKAWRQFPDFLAPEENAPEIRYAPLFDRRLDVDLLLRLQLPRHWEGAVHLNYGSPLPYTKPLASYVYYQYRLSDGRRTLDDQPDSANVGILLEGRNTSRYPAYHRIDISLQKEFVKGWGRLKPHLDILNVYDRRNVLFYLYDFNRFPSIRSGVSMFPFLPTIGLEVSF